MQNVKMITYKTAVLVAAALKMGYIAKPTKLHLIYDFGLNLRIAFQLQDDFRCFGDPELFGSSYGDIIENKKTYLF
jgi:geranylgeranyl diphosphate synthase type II